MKQTILFAVLGVTALGAGAQEVGRVISSTPVIQQVAVPRTYCNQPSYAPPPPTSGAGGLMGAIAGGAIGSTIGHGAGTAAAVLLGVTGGALLGDRIESNGQPPVATQVCGTETTYENRTSGYNVTYEYAGRQFTTQMPYDPGATVQLQVSPIAQGAPTGATTIGTVVTAPPVQQGAAPVYVQAPAPVVYQPYPAYPAYPVYSAYPAYPYPYYRPYFPVGISLGFSVGGHRHYRHR